VPIVVERDGTPLGAQMCCNTLRTVAAASKRAAFGIATIFVDPAYTSQTFAKGRCKLALCC
jgi:hypothetical protein